MAEALDDAASRRGRPSRRSRSSAGPPRETSSSPSGLSRTDGRPADIPSTSIPEALRSRISLGRRSRLFGALAAVGFGASCIAVVSGGLTTTQTTVAPTSWFGLVPKPEATTPGVVFGLLLFASLIALALTWIAAVRLAERADLSERNVWHLGAIWAAPFALGPPIISKDVHAFAAQGALAARGFDPYSANVFTLGRAHSAVADRALAAVDPQWRSSLSPYGPIATLMERVAAQLTGGDPLGTVLVLRAAAVLSVAVLGFAAASLGRPGRAAAVACVVLNPLVLVHAVSGVHFEAEMGALVVAGVLAANRRAWVWAIILICAAGSIKAPAFAVLPIVIVAHIRQRASGPTRYRQMARTALGDVVVSLGCVAAFAAVVPNGLGWARNLSTPSQASTWSVTGGMLAVLRVFTPDSWSGGIRAALTILMLVVALVVIGRLSLAAEPGAIGPSVGLALVTLALLLPVFYPWYLLWGVTCWLVVATRPHRDRLLALCAVASLVAATGTPASVARTVDLVTAITAVVWLRHRARTSAPIDA